MAEEPDPPRRFYDLKPRDFERVNEPPAGSAPTSDAAPTGKPPSSTGRIDVHDLFRQANMPGPVLGQKGPVASNDVHALLRDNLAREDAAGINELTPKPKRRSRRLRDYLVILIAVDAFLGYLAFGPYANAVTFVYGLGGLVFFSCGFTWIMWFVVDDY